MSGIETDIEEVRIDVPRVQAIARRVVAVANDFTATARPLRLASGAPATDPVSLTLAAQANAQRLELGLIGEAAADELTRMAEFVVAGALHVATLGRRTQFAAIGLAARPMSEQIAVSAPMIRTPSLPAKEGWAPESDDELLSFVVLLADGDPEIPLGAPADQATIAAAELAEAAAELRSALSYGGRAADTLVSFAEWIRRWDAQVIAINRAIGEWSTIYREVRVRAEVPAAEYVRWLASTMSGAAGARPGPAGAAEILDRYLQVGIPTLDLPDYPKLAK